MKIAITGHTRGIGKACADVFRHHTIYGYSRSNGYDIKDAEDIFKSAEDCDVFINNAYSHKHQIDLFNLFYNSWEHTNKHIINVNSIVKYPIQKPVLEKYKKDNGKTQHLEKGFAYNSGTNKHFLTIDQIRDLIATNIDPEFKPV